MENGNYSSEPAENVVEAEGAVEAKEYLAENPDLTAALADSLANLEGLDGADVKSLSNDVEDTFRNEPRWGYSTMSDDEIRAHMSEGDAGKSVTAEEQHNGGEDAEKDGDDQAGVEAAVGSTRTVMDEVASAWMFGDIKQKPAEKTEPKKAEESHSEHDSGNKEWGADIKTADDLVKEVDTFWAGNGDANSSSATLKQKIENAELQYLDGNISEEEYKAEFNKLKTVTQKLENVELQFLDGNISEDEYNQTREDLVGDKKAEKNVDADADETDKADKVDKAGETDESGENDVVGETEEDVERVAKSPEERAKETIASDPSWLKLIAHPDENGNLVPDSEQMDILVKNLAELYAEIDEENADVNENKAPESSDDDSATKKVDVKTSDDVEGDKEPSKGQTSQTANGEGKKDGQTADGKKPEQPTENDGGSHEEEDDSKERKTLRGNIVNFVKKGVMPKVKKAVAAALVACTVLGGAHVIAQPVGADSVINPTDTVSTNVASTMEDSATDVASTLKTESESNSVKTDAELGADKMSKLSVIPEINAVGAGEELTAFFSENKTGKHNLTGWLYDHNNLNLSDEQKAEQIWNSWNMLSNDVVVQPQTLALAGDITSLDSGGVTSLDDLTHVLTLSQNDAEFRKAAQSDCLKIMNEIESKTVSKTVDHVNAGDVYSSLYVMNMAGEGEQPRFQYFVDREVTASHDFERLVCRDEDGNSLFDKNEIGGYKYNILKVAGEIPQNASDAEALNIMRGIRMWAPSGECTQIEWEHLTVANAEVYADIVTTPVSPETPDTPPPVTPEIPVDRITDDKLNYAHGDGLWIRDSIPLENKDQVDEMGDERGVVNDHKPREGDAHDAGVNQETGTGRQTLAEDGVSDDSNPESKDTDSANGEGSNMVYDNFSSDGQVLNSNQN